jgi:hypothetical protein
MKEFDCDLFFLVDGSQSWASGFAPEKLSVSRRGKSFRAKSGIKASEWVPLTHEQRLDLFAVRIDEMLSAVCERAHKALKIDDAALATFRHDFMSRLREGLKSVTPQDF